ncbi:PilT/PilU family type 4a pilus ATPase [Myxococcota bacterium]|nr:PilT/PilU family type 4a pilus ATPase [Myxococcota bacterium]
MDEPKPGLIERLLSSAERLGASDVFVAEGKKPAFRIHGKVKPAELPPTTAADFAPLLEKTLTTGQRRRFEETGDLDLGMSLTAANGEDRRYRINLHRLQGRLGLVARALPSGELELGDLGLHDGIGRLAELERGMVLVVGATGSGKSTTLAAMVHRINKTRAAHIVTVEDPIEFVHRDRKSRLTQREVGGDTPSFFTALKEVLRQSPDVIVLGELRDAESVAVAMQAALTGHLILASLHTMDASQTLQRVLSFFPEHQRAQVALDLSMSLKGVVAQRLLPTTDGKGRAVAVELLTVTPPAARLIREQRVEELLDLMRGSTDPDINTFTRALLDLYREGRVTYDVAHAYATNPEEFALAAKGMRTGVEGLVSRDMGASQKGLDMKVLLNTAIERGASDLHLAVGRPPILRLTGSLQPLDLPPLTAADMRTLLYSILSVRQRSTYELERELDFGLQIEDGRRFRVNAYFQKGEMTAALRAIPSKPPDAKNLALPDAILRLSERPHGLLLVVGPTGSGKTTTLACLVDRINRSRACRIITIEDPIEYVHTGVVATVDQREVGADTMSFAGALKYILRQDPDVILVGEMRDLETVSAALTAAETGHLVLATLHSNDAIQTIDRIIDVFPAHQQAQARSMLSSALLAVISQRLLPRRDGVGRVPAFELMVATTALRNLIRDNKMHQAVSVMQGGKGEGMQTMDACLVKLLQDGLIHYEDALRYISSPVLLKGVEEPAAAVAPAAPAAAPGEGKRPGFWKGGGGGA